jgi:hypothetical protein
MGLPFPSQAVTVIAAPDKGRAPDMSDILIVLRGLMEFVIMSVVPLVYPLETSRTLSLLFLVFVATYIGEFAEIAYNIGVAAGNLAARSEPAIVVVPLL